MKKFGKNLLRFSILVFLWFALNLFDFYHLQLNFLSQRDLFGRFLMVVVDVLALFILLPYCKKRGWQLGLILFTVIFGVKTFLTVIEAVYLPMLVPVSGQLLLNGFVAAALFVLAVLFVLNLWVQPDKGTPENTGVSMAWFHWLWKLPLSSFLWMFLFALCGGLIFLPLAKALDPIALSNYSNLDMPVWVLPFQGFRAMLWLFLVMPLLLQLKGTKLHLVFVIGLVMACWMGSNLLAATTMPVGLQFAHLVEVSLETFLFGGWLVLLFVKKEKETNLVSAAQTTGL